MFNRKEFNQIRNGVLLVSLLAWVLLLAGHDGSCCSPAGNGGTSWQMLLASDTPAALIKGWALMLVAMMAPTLVLPVYFIRLTSFAGSCLRLTALFVAGYGAVWLSAGGLFMAVELVAKQLFPHSWWPAMLVALTALMWQASPCKQICLNRCHNHRPLAAFGFAADRDALRMGLTHGIWCIGSCWAIMLLPMLLPGGHGFGMVGVTLLMFCERMDPATAPAWRLRGFRTALLHLNRSLRGSRATQMPGAQMAQS
ncbi:MAG TPA: DUF2182 domain-containing protein [Verrucomicrobiae bacterium]|nr:DUF2182 domain-containing protein [Verrucomicrobiae bacterium]